MVLHSHRLSDGQYWIEAIAVSTAHRLAPFYDWKTAQSLLFGFIRLKSWHCDVGIKRSNLIIMDAEVVATATAATAAATDVAATDVPPQKKAKPWPQEW